MSLDNLCNGFIIGARLILESQLWLNISKIPLNRPKCLFMIVDYRWGIEVCLQAGIIDSQKKIKDNLVQ